MFAFQFVPDLVILYLEQSFTLMKQGTNVQHKRKTQETFLSNAWNQSISKRIPATAAELYPEQLKEIQNA